MINRLKKLYPNFLIFIKKKDKIYDVDNNLIEDKTLVNNNYILINNNSYEVHKKIKKWSFFHIKNIK